MPNLVATKTTGGGMAGAEELIRHAGELQHFMGEGNFPHGAMFGEASLLASYAELAPRMTYALFEAGRTGDAGELMRLQHAFQRMGTDLWAKPKPGPHMDGAYDKMLVKLGMLPEFPLRLLSPYRGFDDDDYRACLRFLQAEYADWLEPAARAVLGMTRRAAVAPDGRAGDDRGAPARSTRPRSTTCSRASAGPSPAPIPGPELHCLFPDLGTLVGYAITSEWTGGEPDAPNEDYLELLELLEAMPKPVVSVLVDVGSRPGRSGIAGDGMMREFQVLGAAGAVVAGSIIDIAGMERLSFPVYATGVVPAYDDMRMAGFGRPVDVGPLRVATGDLLVADRTGVLRVPADAADAVIAGLPGFRALEASVAELLDRPG